MAHLLTRLMLLFENTHTIVNTPELLRIFIYLELSTLQATDTILSARLFLAHAAVK